MFMDKFFLCACGALLLISLLLLTRLFKVKKFSEKFIVILVAGSNIVLLLLLLGFIDGRADMYVDCALSYAVLGFISSLIVARYLERKGEDHGN